MKYIFLCLLQYIQHSPGNSRRGFGIDCAILSCQVCLHEIYLPACFYTVCSVCVLTSLLYVPYVVFSGVHQSDHGGLRSRCCGGSCWQRPCYSPGGLWGLPPWILHCVLFGHLPVAKQRVRKKPLGVICYALYVITWAAQHI